MLKKENWLDRMTGSAPYIWVMGLLTVIANVFGWELPVYTVFVAVAVASCLWGKDLRSMLPLVIYSYLAPSAANNPGREEGSVFYPENGGWYLIVLAVVLIGALIYRFIRDRKTFFAAKRKLLPGILALSAAYFLSGILYEGYGEIAGGNLLFATLQVGAISVCYLVFTGAIDWKSLSRDYFSHVGAAVGTVVCLEVVAIYMSGRPFVEGGVDWHYITTGWGINNNMGAMIAIMLPFAFCLARKNGWWHLLAVFFMSCICLTCSRNAMLFGGICYAIGLVDLFVHSQNKLGLLVAYGLGLVLSASLLWDMLAPYLSHFFERGLDSSNREEIYLAGLKQFQNNPIFGGSFFPNDFNLIQWSALEAFSSFFPPRWHNTFVQILASCGLVGMGAYGFHRAQTLWVWLKNRSLETTYVGLSVGVLLAVSLLDCHFFNVGPTLFYSMALAVMEKLPKE